MADGHIFVCGGVVNAGVSNRRVTRLYGAGTYFLCRHCDRLAFASQRENSYDRALRRDEKIRKRVDGDPARFPERRKGMHRKIYERSDLKCRTPKWRPRLSEE
jgi:hypothetical protein